MNLRKLMSYHYKPGKKENHRKRKERWRLMNKMDKHLSCMDFIEEEQPKDAPCP